MVALGYPLPRRHQVTRAYGQVLIGLDPRPHTGIDLEAPGNTPVLAAAAGTARTWWDFGGGRMAAIDHGGGVETRYAHMAADMVTNGQAVAAGQQIGIVGATGALVTGAHLHYEVLINGRTVDPAPYLGGASAVTVTQPAARVCVSRQQGPDGRAVTIPVPASGQCPVGYIGPFNDAQPLVPTDDELVGQLFNLALPPLLEPALNIAVVAGGALLIWRGVMTMLRP